MTILLLLFLAVRPAGAHAAPMREPAAPILRAVIAREAADYGPVAAGDDRPCVRPALAAPALDTLRRAIRHPWPDGPQLPLRERVAIQLRTMELPWSAPDPGDPSKLGAVDPAERKRLTESVGRMIARDAGPTIAKVVGADALSEPFRFCRTHRELSSLELSVPEVEGDLAFVRAEFECVLCGHGTAYALRKRGKNWRIVAEWTSWVS